MVKVHIPQLFRQQAGGATTVEATGTTLREIVADLVRQFPALENRVIDDAGIRPEILLAVGADEAFDANQAVAPGSEVFILPAIAGG
ncbi:hypothetical protein AYO38_11605 [bacterium SCGC AG-212-C10]|nr:hypothetical protein AYO38_11605 [bacterium SCGC AG-212-C10]